jgi:FkbH-like protein
MKLAEALQLAREPREDGIPFRVNLVRGFAPLHLETFLVAHLSQCNPRYRPVVTGGLYGDCAGNLERVSEAECDGVALVMEWQDLDPRLGIRRASGWGLGDQSDMINTARLNVGRLVSAIHKFQHVTVVICLPTLPLPPIDVVPGWQEGPLEIAIRGELSRFAETLAALPRCKIVSGQRLDAQSPPADRFDVRMELAAGFPYRTKHASVVAQCMAQLLAPPQAKRGLITDLDDTLWSGLVGEIGVESISWTLDQGSQIHALYQQMLASLAESGVLVAVASKNDSTLVRSALARSDLIVGAHHIFPVEVSWKPKSEAVSRILKAWNIAADSVVFVDDSPLELAEVKAAFPEIDCLPFPREDPEAAFALFGRLRDLFGKEVVTDEDLIRSETLRRAQDLATDRTSARQTEDEFLRSINSTVTIQIEKDAADPRPLALVNKTNQFNLNGTRYNEASWSAYLNNPTSTSFVVSYEDKYGPLGKIAVVAGRKQGSTFLVDIWVMSCRAFSRHIEHACVATIFDHLGVEEIEFMYKETPRNEPMRDFLTALLGSPSAAGRMLSRSAFSRLSAFIPPVKVAAHG